MEKYYVPEISEFHVGFECELYHNYSMSKDSFDKEIYDSLTPIWWNRVMEDLIKNSEVRVKYLDREDIESEGWKFTGRSIDIWFEKEGNFDMGTWTSYKATLHYGLHDKRMCIDMRDTGQEGPSVFKGTIKNISEFRRLQQQLNIK